MLTDLFRRFTLTICLLLGLTAGDCGGGNDSDLLSATPGLVRAAFPNLRFSFPVDFQALNDGSGRLFVVEKAGRIQTFLNDATADEKTVFLDISNLVRNQGEQGLLGLAFPPDFTATGFFFVYYSGASCPVTGAAMCSRLARYTVNNPLAIPAVADPNSEELVFELAQPFSNHNAGQLSFGVDDDFLYVALGDGGSGGDPQGNGQNRNTLLGSLLRIDVSTTGTGLDPNYSIPANNPLVGQANVREEIFAFGLRNPYRFSIDAPPGQAQRIWLADVGQDAVEEVNVIVSGGNYGWNTMEGSQCFPPASGCDQTGLILPVTEYGHNVGQSITGGYVYRGSRLPEVVGRYFFADFVSGVLFSAELTGPNSASQRNLGGLGFNPSSFGIDFNGEVYVLEFAQEAQIFSLDSGIL